MKRFITKYISSSHTFFVGIIILVSLNAFWKINNIFFRQDEWVGLGGALSRRENGGLFKVIEDVFESFTSSRFLPLSSITNYIVYNLFGINTSYYGVMGLGATLINAILLYAISYILTKSKIAAVIVALLWITNNLVFQSISWIATMIPSQFALMFFLISFLFLFLYIY